MKGKANHQMHRTATTRCVFEWLGLIGHSIRCESPVPVAVGDLGRWAISEDEMTAWVQELFGNELPPLR
jgi:hypothetical protein